MGKLTATDKTDPRGLTDAQRLMLAIIRQHNMKTGEAMDSIDTIDTYKALLKQHGNPIAALRAVTGALS